MRNLRIFRQPFLRTPVTRPQLQLSRNSTFDLWEWNELHVEGCRLLSRPMWLLLPVFGFAILDSVIHVVVAELEHAINKSTRVCAIAVIALGAPSLDRRRRNFAPSIVFKPLTSSSEVAGQYCFRSTRALMNGTLRWTTLKSQVAGGI